MPETKLQLPTIAPYGSWKSPITSSMIVAKTISFDMIGVDGEAIYWVEVRPQEGGRHCLVHYQEDGKIVDVMSQGFNARTRVHEYGGGAFCVSDGIAYFANYADQRLYSARPGMSPQAITVEPVVPAGLRFADMVVDKTRNCMYYVCEQHSADQREPKNFIGRIDLPAQGHSSSTAQRSSNSVPREPDCIASGCAFYASLKISPDSKQLAYLCWNHPDMPWDATTLNIATIAADGSLTNSQQITSGSGESIFQPEWGPDGLLYYVSDRNGWWNLYRYDGKTHEPLCPMDAEFGQAQWRFGLSLYAFHGSDEIICAFNHGAVWKFGRLNLKTKVFAQIPTKYTDIQWLKVIGDNAIFRGASPSCPQEIVRLDLLNGKTKILKTSANIEIDPGVISTPQSIEFPTTFDKTSHAFYYAPRNPAWQGPVNGKPPLLVKCHGGPSGTTSSMLNLEIQYWTSRGFAVVDVNYGGSTGYGRQYRQRLNGQWGIVDVDDVTNAALYLVSQGLVDDDQLLISGRSAGGYTVLCALTFKEVFAGGASYYGISDIEALANDTHKFESRYDQTLIGPYPEGRQLYQERSAIYHTEQLHTPIIFFQGTEDKVVLPNQTQKMLDALKQKGIPCAVIMFEGERHGFSKAETIKQCLEGELYFYQRILGIPLSEELPTLTIFNAEKLPSKPEQ